MSDEEKKSKDSPETAKGSSKMILIVAIMGVLLVAAIAGVVVLLLKPSASTAGEKSEKEKKEAVAPAAELGPVVDMESFVVNVKNGGGQAYLKTAISVEMVDAAAQDSFSKWTKLMRNEVLMYLSGIDIEKSHTTKEKRQMEADLRNLMNQRLGSKSVKGVYFTEFVTQ